MFVRGLSSVRHSPSLFILCTLDTAYQHLGTAGRTGCHVLADKGLVVRAKVRVAVPAAGALWRVAGYCVRQVHR